MILKRRSGMNNTWWFMIGNCLCVDYTLFRVIKRMYKLRKRNG